MLEGGKVVRDPMPGRLLRDKGMPELTGARVIIQHAGIQQRESGLADLRGQWRAACGAERPAIRGRLLDHGRFVHLDQIEPPQPAQVPSSHEQPKSKPRNAHSVASRSARVAIPWPQWDSPTQ